MYESVEFKINFDPAILIISKPINWILVLTLVAYSFTKKLILI